MSDTPTPQEALSMEERQKRIAEAIMSDVESGRMDEDVYQGEVLQSIRELTAYCRRREQEHQEEMAKLRNGRTLYQDGIREGQRLAAEEIRKAKEFHGALVEAVERVLDEWDVHGVKGVSRHTRAKLYDAYQPFNRAPSPPTDPNR